MATRREIFIACQMAVIEAITKEHGADFPLEKLAYLATQYGRSSGVTEQEASEMLTKPMCDIV